MKIQTTYFLHFFNLLPEVSILVKLNVAKLRNYYD